MRHGKVAVRPAKLKDVAAFAGVEGVLLLSAAGDGVEGLVGVSVEEGGVAGDGDGKGDAEDGGVVVDGDGEGEVAVELPVTLMASF